MNKLTNKSRYNYLFLIDVVSFTELVWDYKIKW